MQIQDLRAEIDKVDKEIKILFLKRMEIAKAIGDIKKSQGLAIEDKEREITLIENNSKDLPEETKEYYKDLLKQLIRLSKDYQNA